MMNIKKAVFADLPKILHLQKQAFLSEAKLLNDFSIQPLTQTLEELEKEFVHSTILKIENDKNEIIGSVRFYEKNDRVYIGKLIVHPDYQNKGIGTQLLKSVGTNSTNKVFELFTSSKSERNIHLYKKLGYKEFKRKIISAELEFVFMEKMKD
jgi:ribosomal protein S18 acetylase RimI-like enzyme